MGIVSAQFDKRKSLDKEKLNRAYESLVDSVNDTNTMSFFNMDDVEEIDRVASTCIRYCGAIPGEIPENVKDLRERIEYMCRSANIMHRTIRLESGWYKNTFGALMGKLKSGEAVAILPGKFNGYYYLEPITGKYIRLNKKTEGNLEKRAEMFYPSFPTGKMAYDDLFKFIVNRMDRGDLLLIVVSAMAAMLVGMLPAFVTQVAYGTVAPSGMVELIAPVICLLFGVAVSTLLIRMYKNLIIGRICMKIGVYTEAATFSRLLNFPSSFFRKNSPGSLAFIQTQMVNAVESLISIVLGGGLTFVLSIVYVIQIHYYAESLLPIVLIVIAVQCIVMYVYIRMALRYESKALNANATVNGMGNSLLKGFSKIKLSGAEDRSFAVWAKKYATYTQSLYNRPTFLYYVETIVSVIGMIGIIVIYLTSIQEEIDTANYMAFNTSYGQITTAMVAFFAVVNNIVTAISSAKLIKPVLEQEAEVADEGKIVNKVTGSVEISGVSFRYDKDMPLVLNNLSISVKPGEYVGIVGSSGCGKSTLIRILLGFEKPEVGRVMYDSYDITEVDLRTLRSKTMSVVMQDSKLIKGDIYHNIILSSPEATIQDAWEAAEIAGIADDIKKMPMGMNTLVSEGGGGISGGQRQRIIIARAVCSKRKIMILDEATSALDNITQQHVADSLAKLKCTRIVVAHRLSTVRHCDRIVVLDKGSVAEMGTYEELIEKNGMFAKLVERQRLEGV